MNRISVQSSSIAAVGYDPATMTLEVEFNNGNIYQYFDVPETTHQGLMSADSCGGFLNGNIKGLYRYAKS